MTLFDMPDKSQAAKLIDPKQAQKIVQVNESLTSAFGTIEQNHCYPFATGAQWSNHDLIEYIVDQTGPAEITACTWSMAEHACVKLIAMLDDGRLTRINMLCDWRVQSRTPAAIPLAKHRFADFRVTTCHAKVFVIENAEWKISCVGSANFTNNPRIEAGHLSTSPDCAEFHRLWIMGEIRNAKPFGIDMRKHCGDGRK